MSTANTLNYFLNEHGVSSDTLYFVAYKRFSNLLIDCHLNNEIYMKDIDPEYTHFKFKKLAQDCPNFNLDDLLRQIKSKSSRKIGHFKLK